MPHTAEDEAREMARWCTVTRQPVDSWMQLTRAERRVFLDEVLRMREKGRRRRGQ